MATAFAQACALVRYALLARLLGPEQLGIASILVLTAQFFDSIADSGSDRFLVQDRDGDEPRVQGLVQGVFAARGLLISLVLAAIATPAATYYRMPALETGFLLLALSPLAGGLIHMDLRRAQRRNDFRIEGAAVLASEAASLVVTAIACLITRDFTAVIYGLITKSAVTALVSHVMAERKYRINYAADVAPRLATFAAPLILNGLLLFVGSQSDRLLVAHELGLAELGKYSAVMLLVFYPAAMVTRFMSALHLPLISRWQQTPDQLGTAADILGGQSLLLGLGVAVGFAIVGPLAVHLIYDSRYMLPVTATAMIGVLQGVRLIRLWPTTVALGLAKSSIVLTANIVRLSGLAFAVVGINLGGLVGAMIGLTMGEIAALATALFFTNRLRDSIGRRDLERFATISVAIPVILFAAWQVDAPSAVGLALAAVAALGLVAISAVREQATIRAAFELANRQFARARKV